MGKLSIIRTSVGYWCQIYRKPGTNFGMLFLYLAPVFSILMVLAVTYYAVQYQVVKKQHFCMTGLQQEQD